MATTTTAPPIPPAFPEQQQPLAALWHTAVLILLIVGVSALGAYSTHQLAQRSHVAQYLATMAWEWLLVAYVLWGTKRNGITFRNLVGGKWNGPEDALIDVVIAVGFWIAAAIVLFALSHALGLAKPEQVEAAKKQLLFLAPHGRLELSLWVLLSATAGFCEEIIFRGYLQRQFAVLSGNVWVGLIISAVLFGAGHGYEGSKRMILIAVFGAMFGVLTILRKSLRPGMMAHAFHDTLSGIALSFIK